MIRIRDRCEADARGRWYAQESIKAVRAVLTDRDEGDGDTGGDTDGVLNVEVLWSGRDKHCDNGEARKQLIRTASIPACERVWVLTPPSRVWRVKVVDELMSGRKAVRNCCCNGQNRKEGK